MLNKVNQNHLEQASGKLVLQKTMCKKAAAKGKQLMSDLLDENLADLRREPEVTKVGADLMRRPARDVRSAELGLDVVPLARVRRGERASDGQRVRVLAVGG